MPLDTFKKILTTGLPEDERLKAVLQQAMDEALRLHLVKLFGVMMQDPSGQPERAMTGVEKAVKSWRSAVQAFKEPLG